MFDFSSGELLVIAVVALVVLGPERLPKAARLIGMWVRKARNQWNSVRDELERELAAEELKRELKTAQNNLRKAEDEIRQQTRDTERDLIQTRDDSRHANEDRPVSSSDAGGSMNQASPLQDVPSKSRDANDVSG